MNLKTMKHLFAFAAAALLAFGAQAKNYTTVFEQDFENSDTYTDNFVWGTLDNAAFGTTKSTPVETPKATVTRESRKIYGTENYSSFFQFKQSNKYYRKEGSYYQFTEAVTNLMDYQIEFDWYPAASTSGTCSGLAIQGKNGVLATFYMTSGTKNGCSTVTLYPGDDKTATAITTFKTTQRSTEPTKESDTDYDNAIKYWMHITIVANADDGVVMSVLRADGGKVLTNYRLGNFDNVISLYQYYSAGNDYGKWQTLDDVVVGEAVGAQQYTWTGEAGDNMWATPGNWMVGGVTQMEYYPGGKDTALIAGEGLVITAAVGLAVSNLNLAAGCQLVFDADGIETDKQVALLDVQENVGAALTAENILLTGYSADAYAAKIDFSTMPITVGLYSKTKFFWTGNVSDNLFSTPANWAYGAEGGPAAATAPTGSSTVTFPESFADGVAVTFDGDTSGDGIYFVLGCDVTFASDSTKMRTIYPWTIKGEGTLSLANHITLQTVTGKSMTVDTDVNVLPSAGADPWAAYARFYLRGEKSNVTLNGDIKGSGYLYLDGDGNRLKYYYIYGDMSGFSGKIYTAYDWSDKSNDEANTTRLSSAAALNLGSATLEVVGRVWVMVTNDVKTVSVGALYGTGVINNRNDEAMTLEVGALNANASASVTLTNNNDSVAAWTVKKVGTGCQTLTDATVAYNVDLTAGELGVPAGKEFYDVALNGGKFKFAIPYDDPWTNGTFQTLFTCTSGIEAGRAVDYVSLDLSAFESAFSAEYNNAEANTLKVRLNPTAAIWNGPVGGRWSKASNWLVDGEPALAAPGAGNAVMIGEGAVIAVDADQAFGTMNADSTATLAVMFTDDVLTFTAPSDFTGTIVAAGPYSMTGEGGVYTATRIPGEFAWSGAAEDGQWSSVGNWSVAGLPVAVVPTTGDNVTIAQDAVISTSAGNGNASNLTVNANVTLTGGGNLYVGPRTDTAKTEAHVEGSGKLTLSGVNLYAGFNKVVVSLPLEIAAGTINQLMCCATKINKDAYGHGFKVTGKVTGSGKIEITQNTGENNLNTGVELDGDFSEFAGEVEYYAGRTSRSGKIAYQLRALDIIHTNSTSALSRWDIYADRYPDAEIGRDRGNYFADADATYKFGSLQLRLPDPKNDTGYKGNVTLEVGALDEDSKILNDWKRAENAGVNWIAPTATWMQDAANQAFLNVKGGGNVYVTHTNTLPAALTFADKGGTLKVGYDLAIDPYDVSVTNAVPVDPSAKIMNSTAAIAFDDQGTNATWATALAASNVGGFTKKGAGTLTFAEIPEYAGVTKVEAGELVVPAGTKVTLDAVSAGAFTGGEITNVVFGTAETTTTVVSGTSATTVRAFAGPVDYSNVTVDLSEKTDWAKDATYYVVTSAGIVAGTDVNKRNCTLILPEGEKGEWKLGVVELAGYGKVLAVTRRTGLVVIIR